MSYKGDGVMASIVSPYGEKHRVSVSFPEFSPVTKQEHKDECDINFIMGRYLTSGQVPAVNQLAPQYLDVSAGTDFQSAMQFVAGAQSLFNELPVHLRTRFSNDPRQFVDFCSNPANRDEMQTLGLLKPAQEIVVKTPESVINSPPAPVAEASPQG